MARLRGTSSGDLIIGYEVDDLIYGRAGDDSLRGSGGHDLIKGDRGADNIQGGYGNDRIWGGIGDDTLLGGDDSTDSAYSGWDELRGGLGNDRLIAVNGFAAGDRGDDHIELSNGRAEGAFGNDILVGAVGLGRSLVQVGGQGADLFSLTALVGTGGGAAIVADLRPWEGDRLALSFVNVVTGESMAREGIVAALDSNGSGVIGDGDPQIAQPGNLPLPEQNAIVLGFEHSLILIQGMSAISADWIV